MVLPPPRYRAEVFHTVQAGTETVRCVFFLAEQLWGEEATAEYFLLVMADYGSRKPEPLSVLQAAALDVCLPCLVTFSE